MYVWIYTYIHIYIYTYTHIYIYIYIYIHRWNHTTNQTTALGAPKPSSEVPAFVDDGLGGGSSGLEAWYSTGSRERAPTQYFDLASQDDGPSGIPVKSASGQAAIMKYNITSYMICIILTSI